MINCFKYDYNNKLFIINFLLSIIFLGLSVLAFEKTLGFLVLLIISILALFNAFVVIRAQGIKIKRNTDLIIVDQLSIRKLKLKDIKHVSLNPIPKTTKSRLYGFFHEFFLPTTYFSHCDYTYNGGKVYIVQFYMRDGSIIESYFGWLYREKKKTVDTVEKKLLNFIKTINILCDKNQKLIKRNH